VARNGETRQVNSVVQDRDFTLYLGDALEVLRELPAGSVDCCVTSPPYWGLRDYGTGQWDGGDFHCDHLATARHKGRDVCGYCGAMRVDRQLGLEATPQEYVANMVAVFREIRRVLADHGTCWVNLGDSYAGGGRGGHGGLENVPRWGKASPPQGDAEYPESFRGMRAKDLCGIPWRVAFALQTDGWYLRSDIIWAKPNPMPESVTDRPTKAHEYVFLLTKKARYWFDQEAVRELAEYGRRIQGAFRSGSQNGDGHRSVEGSVTGSDPAAGRNVRSVWEIATQPYAEAHFATFPKELARRCILAGCPEWVCRMCGKPRERIVERTGGTTGSGMDTYVVSTLGWSDCGHHDYRPGIVLDPFMGSGTTALVAREQARHAIGIELNPEYARLAARRLQQLSLLAKGVR
jgi:DNA modification methylase